MVAFTYRMPSGIPGDVTRPSNSIIEPISADSAAPFTAYGVFMKTVSGKAQPIASGDAATVINGVLVRPYPSNAAASAPLGSATPPTSGVLDRLVRGYITVKLSQGTAARDAAVYVRVTADTGKAVGDIETAADSGKCVAVTNCVFMGAADASGNVEIRFNI